MFNRRFFAVLLSVLPVFSRAEVVVITEDPVAAFTLPDGSVVSNAFVFRRSAEGLMVVHDDGQYFLNYKLLNDEWRTAYGVEGDSARIEVGNKRFDQYLVFPILERIGVLPNTTIAYLQSEQCTSDTDGSMLGACALQCLLDGNFDKAIRLQQILNERFSGSGGPPIDTFVTLCESCSGRGNSSNPCPVCTGSGICPKCKGAGELAADLSSKPMPCTTCRGRGKCLKCKGVGTLTFQCIHCKGRGKTLDYDRVRSELKQVADRLHEQCAAAKKAP